MLTCCQRQSINYTKTESTHTHTHRLTAHFLLLLGSYLTDGRESAFLSSRESVEKCQNYSLRTKVVIEERIGN